MNASNRQIYLHSHLAPKEAAWGKHHTIAASAAATDPSSPFSRLVTSRLCRMELGQCPHDALQGGTTIWRSRSVRHSSAGVIVFGWEPPETRNSKERSDRTARLPAERLPQELR